MARRVCEPHEDHAHTPFVEAWWRIWHPMAAMSTDMRPPVTNLPNGAKTTKIRFESLDHKSRWLPKGTSEEEREYRLTAWSAKAGRPPKGSPKEEQVYNLMARSAEVGSHCKEHRKMSLTFIGGHLEMTLIPCLDGGKKRRAEAQ